MTALFTRWKTVRVFSKLGDAVFMKAFLEHERIPVRLKREMIAFLLGLISPSRKSPIGVVLQVPQELEERAATLIENFSPAEEETDPAQES